MANGKMRRILILALGITTLLLGSILLFYPAPDLSAEQEIIQKIAEHLLEKLHHANTLNDQRKIDLQDQYDDNNSALNKKLATFQSQGYLSGNFSQSYDLSLPGVSTFLPHTVNYPTAFNSVFKISQNRAHVSLVIGIPTVKRQHQSYLVTTLQSVLDNMTEDEMKDTLIVIFIAETDPAYVYEISSDIQKQFNAHLESGLLEVISPPIEFYPDPTTLKKTLGDDMERVVWRSKQNLDFAFLMMYAKSRGTFYVQLEDDVLTKKGFVSTMKNFALEKESWFVIDFCQLGFIGKMFKGIELPWLIQFFLMFYNDKPVDWLLHNMIQTKVCKLDQDHKKCNKEKEKLWIHYKPSLFQHIGTHSSLKGKVQKLKDRQFGRVQLFVPHKNPHAYLETQIKHYKHYSLARAYQGEAFFWGIVPQADDTITFIFQPPIYLESYKLVSGNAEHPSDRFFNTTCEIVLSDMNKGGGISKLPPTKDGYLLIGGFDHFGIADGTVGRQYGTVDKFRMTVHASSDNWALLSEIHFKVAS